MSMIHYDNFLNLKENYNLINPVVHFIYNHYYNENNSIYYSNNLYILNWKIHKKFRFFDDKINIFLIWHLYNFHHTYNLNDNNNINQLLQMGNYFYSCKEPYTSFIR